MGTTSRLLGLPTAAGGPVQRIWFGTEGQLFARLENGVVVSSRDLGDWAVEQSAKPPAAIIPETGSGFPPEPGARVVRAAGDGVAYAFGRHVWISRNGGLSWDNRTGWRGRSLLGGTINDLSVDPNSPERIAVASTTGVWISSDGGASWIGNNDTLPGFQVSRILSAPSGARGVVVSTPEGAYEWAPGQRAGWLPVTPADLEREAELKRRAGAALQATVATVAGGDAVVYAGGSGGRLWATSDGGRQWRAFQAGPGAGDVQRIWLDPADSRVALAALGAGADPQAPRVLRTVNGGVWWDDLTANLPGGGVNGIAADAETGAVYAATQSGVWMTVGNLQAPAPATDWAPLNGGLPSGPARDVLLDSRGLHLFAALEGHGVYLTAAPHRRLKPLLVHAADFGNRPASPGALLSLFGTRAQGGSANRLPVVLLAAGENESQLQLPFDLAGGLLQVVLNTPDGDRQVGMNLREAAPAILVDREGTPMVLDADSGLQLDAMNPARPGMRLQILVTGLGRVDPPWTAGLAAPLENAPRVVAPVQARLNGAPARVLRAILAPGYVGYYLVEVELPALLDAGPAELTVEAAGVGSNRVRVYVEQ